MGHSVAIAIGVAKVLKASGYAFIPDARVGAQKFHAWASPRFDEVHLLTDDVKPVLLHDVRSLVYDIYERAQDARNFDRLFIYFAGHGVNNGTGQACWLLSKAATLGEAINLTKCREDAVQLWIPHVAFFGDACRDPSHYFIRGFSVFPPVTDPGKTEFTEAEVDTFLATRPGGKAHGMPSAPGEQRKGGYGLYTKYLLNALNGGASDAIEPTPGGVTPHAVISHKLRDHLRIEVPWAAGMYGLVQQPHADACSHWRPNVMAWVQPPGSQPSSPKSGPGTDGPSSPTAPSGHSGGEGPALTASDARKGDPGRPPTAPSGRVGPMGPGSEEPDLLDEFEANRDGAEAALRKLAGSATGISVEGARIIKIQRQKSQHSPYEIVDGSLLMRHTHKKPGPAILQLDRPWRNQTMWSAAAFLPGYTTQMRVGEHGVEHMAYMEEESEIGVLAWATARARWGSLLSDDPWVQAALWQTLNPVLTVLAAHSYQRVGQVRMVRKIYDQLREKGLPVPFDVALIALGNTPSGPHIIPGYPWTIRGWYLLERTQYGKALAKFVEQNLAPSFWTTLLDPSQKVLDELIKRDC
ncbi:caspase family protein [Streptomyces dysideae]|uniref:caspase family protein n=1 Tax=Streptomyces dysideae TaxID=909626 RepID=UPI000A50BFF9|nr:caspase family protein [Streptomyces dysideae]